MIKDIQSASESYEFKSNNYKLYEKLDMFYFKVIINDFTCTLLSHKHKIITPSDIIINSMWKDIYEFVCNYIKPKQHIISEKYNHVIIGFFYCPVEKPLNIKYEKFFNNKNQNNKFIINNVKNKNGEEINVSDFCLDINLLNVRGIGGGPIIHCNTDITDILNVYKNKEISKDTLINLLYDKIETFSGNNLDNIEGIIIKDNKNIYQIKINSFNSPKIKNRSDFESLLIDFIDTFNNLDLSKKYNLYDINTNYQNIVSDIFIQYIEKSNIINQIGNKDNLLPPGNSYIADLSYDMIHNKNIETICKLNDIYKNIFRILFKGLKHHKKHTSYNINFNDEYIKKWNDIVDKINILIH